MYRQFIKELTVEDGSFLKEIFSFSKTPLSMLLGYAAEIKLIEYLRAIPGFTNIEKISDSSKIKGDLYLKGTNLNLRIEVKCIKKGSIVEDKIRGKVSIKNSDSWSPMEGIKTTNPPKGQWDILAICTYTSTGTWDFLFISNKRIESSKLGEDFLPSTIIVDSELTPYLYTDILDVIHDLS